MRLTLAVALLAVLVLPAPAPAQLVLDPDHPVTVTLPAPAIPDKGLPAAAPTSLAPAVAIDRASLAADLLARHNAERAARRLPPLAPDVRLATAAQVQADDCARRHVLSHTGSDGSDVAVRVQRTGYRRWALGENAIRGWTGQAIDPADVMTRWMASPGHRANILGAYRHVGFGVATARDGTGYAVAVFASPR